MDKNKLKGMIIGVALGDALGAPHEFKYNKVTYTGKLEYPIKHFNRFTGERVYPIGSITDDTQMTMTLINSIIRKGKYDRNDAILSYEQWTTVSRFMGKNTRKLFHGVKTIKGYESRYKKEFDTPMDTWTQSNGSLMRCSPFIIFTDYAYLKIDTELSNPHPINLSCSYIYMFVLRSLMINGILPQLDILKAYTNFEPVTKVIEDVQNKVVRDIKDNGDLKDPLVSKGSFRSSKGWVCTALYSALYTIYNIDDMYTAFKFIIDKGGDTDTNAAILGALFGIKLGYDSMKDDPNIKILFDANPEFRDLDYKIEQLILLSQ